MSSRFSFISDRAALRAPRLSVAVLAFIAFVAPAHGQGKSQKVPKLPQRLLTATYVYVEAYDGDSYDVRLLPEDRRAIADVETAIEKWGRYQLTTRRSDAEIVIQVRKGRLASLTGRVGGSVGTGPHGTQFPPTSRTETGTNAGGVAEVGPPDDLLWVYDIDGKGNLSTRYWQRTEKDGLDTPRLELFQKFKRDVEAAAAAQAQAKKNAAPSPAAPNSATTPTPAHP